jgi:methionyl aminopeptidase
MGRAIIKSKKDIEIISEGGEKLARIKAHLKEKINVGVSALEIEDLAVKLIKKEGGKSSFKMVPNYNWATCVNLNEGVVHGIPKSEMVFKKGDIVSVDVGIYYKGFHTDTSFSVSVKDDKHEKFLSVGKKALEEAIKQAKPGNRVYDISKTIEKVLKEGNCVPVKALVGHGIGKDLHEEPQIPCFVNGKRKDYPDIPEGAVLAIEVMYTKEDGKVRLASDGWTIETHDGKISALFEETVAVTKKGPIIITR